MTRAPLITGPFLLCALANFLQGMAFNLYLHLPGFLQQLGAGEVQIGFIFGLTAAVAIVVRPWLGRAMDSHGRRRLILAGGALNVVVCCLYLTVGRLGPWIYAVRVGHGLAEAALFAAFFTQAADLVPASRCTGGLALFGVSGMLPISFGGLMGDAILARADYAAVFAASVVLAASSLALSLPLRDAVLSSGELPNRGFVAAALQRDLLPVWFVGTVFATALAAYFTFLKTFVLATGIGSVGGFFTAYALSAVSLRLFFAWLPERVGPKRVLFPALAVLALGLVLLARTTRASEVVAAGILCGLGHGFVFPILLGLVVERARAAERGAALSVFTALFDGGVLLGGPSLGAVIRFGSYPVMFNVAALLVLTGSTIFALWDRRCGAG
ncbi:MAG: MFS transporter [Deltaproteobacteria bacterium]|nr:MFS transporter [Deltaproteobacteria bacterium]